MYIASAFVVFCSNSIHFVYWIRFLSPSLIIPNHICWWGSQAHILCACRDRFTETGLQVNQEMLWSTSLVLKARHLWVYVSLILQVYKLEASDRVCKDGLPSGEFGKLTYWTFMRLRTQQYIVAICWLFMSCSLDWRAEGCEEDRGEAWPASCGTNYNCLPQEDTSQPLSLSCYKVRHQAVLVKELVRDRERERRGEEDGGRED